MPPRVPRSPRVWSNGDSLIKKHSLSANRLRNHSVTGAQINMSKLGNVPSATNAEHASSASSASSAVTAATEAAATNATRAVSAASTDGYFNSGLVTLAASTTSPGTQQTITTKGPFSFIARCLDNGGGSFSASLIVKDNSATGAVEEDDFDGNTNPGNREAGRVTGL